MNSNVPCYLGLFNIREASFCLVKFDSEQTAQMSGELLCKSILFDDQHKPHEASWAQFSPPYGMFDLMTKEEVLHNEDYLDAPLIKWQDVLLGNFKPYERFTR